MAPKWKPTGKMPACVGVHFGSRVAPFHTRLVALGLEDPAVAAPADAVLQRLAAERIEVLFDDRPARAGEKFSDADLIGIPVRITVSKRTAEQGKVEYKLRREAKAEILSLDEAVVKIRDLCESK